MLHSSVPFRRKFLLWFLATKKVRPGERVETHHFSLNLSSASTMSAIYEGRRK